MLKIIENYTDLSNETIGKFVDDYIKESKTSIDTKADLAELTFVKDNKFYVVFANYDDDKFVFRVYRVYEQEELDNA